jgi:hypothetical protein
MRTIHTRYEDPLDRLWITCAERVGLGLVREAGAYASTDGRGTLTLAPPEELDPDDSLAQMIFHELCHSLVEGPAAFERLDWGLDNTSDDDVLREHACLRLQAFLARSRGLGTVLAPTTDFRLFYDALGPDPFARSEGERAFSDEAGSLRSITLAKQALARVRRQPWSPHLLDALEATAVVAQALGPWTSARASSGARPSIWTTLEPPAAPNLAGLPLPRSGSAAARETCSTCGFHARRGRASVCLKADARTTPHEPACERWEPQPRCEECGACCREAFDVIEVGAGEVFARKHRSLLVVRGDGSLDLPRPGGRCPPLRGEGTEEAPYRCALHADRPRTCRDFTVGTEACLTARRRVGLST